ncbi:MAG TPA: hypothetical protein PLA90_07665 [Candidatus Sumerlaeota bacterium]|nr:hypothetical protein [Candidatus Sumerlaeota bacterium]
MNHTVDNFEKTARYSVPNRLKTLGLVVCLSIFTAILSCGPVVYGWWYTSKDSIYMGSERYLQQDQMVYYSIVRQGYQGGWLLSSRYSNELDPPVFWSPFYMGIGNLARGGQSLVFLLTGISLPAYVSIPVAYHLVRALLVLVLVWSIYGLTGSVFRHPFKRIWTTVLALFAGGVLLKESFTEAQNLQNALFFPHFVMAQILYVWTLWGFLSSVNKRNPWVGAVGLCAAGGFGLGWVHPYTLLPLFCIGVVFFFSLWITRRRLPLCLLICGCIYVLSASIPVLYFYLVMMKIPSVSELSQNNVLYWLYWWQPLDFLEVYLFGAFLLGVPVLWGRRRVPRFLFLLVWVLVGTAMLWAPVQSQRRLIEGLPIGFAFSWVVGIESLVIHPVNRRLGKALSGHSPGRLGSGSRLVRNGVFLVTLLLLLPRTSYLYYRACFRARHPVCYEKKNVVRAYEWMAINTDWSSVVWASEKTGSHIPYFSGNRVFVGNWGATSDYAVKYAWTESLMKSGLPVGTFRQIVRDASIRYLFCVSPADEEVKDFHQYDPETVAEPVYDVEGVRIYPIGLGDSLQSDNF